MLEVNNFFIMQELEPFIDRADAGTKLATALAQALAHHAGIQDVLVLALPRGGVPVAFPIAQALGAELDLMLVRKLGLPNQPEFAMGAIASGGVQVLQPGVPGLMGVTRAEVDAVIAAEQAELARRERRYRGERPPCRVAGRCVILVDDGIATGSTMLAAVEASRRRRRPRRRWTPCAAWSTTWYAWSPRPAFAPSGSGIATSGRPAMKKCRPCWRRRGP
jgi:putative phosphoribosyl transferase